MTKSYSVRPVASTMILPSLGSVITRKAAAPDTAAAPFALPGLAVVADPDPWLAPPQPATTRAAAVEATRRDVRCVIMQVPRGESARACAARARGHAA